MGSWTHKPFARGELAQARLWTSLTHPQAAFLPAKWLSRRAIRLDYHPYTKLEDKTKTEGKVIKFPLFPFLFSQILILNLVLTLTLNVYQQRPCLITTAPGSAMLTPTVSGEGTLIFF